MFRPTSLDVVVASHLLLLLKPPYPVPHSKTLLIESYPTLASYSQRIYDLVFTTGTLDIRSASFIGDLPTLRKGRMTKKAPSAEDVRFERMRWAFFGLVGGAFAAYLAVVAKDVKIEIEDEESVEETETVTPETVN
jgi:sorting and assembly machinery component 37